GTIIEFYTQLEINKAGKLDDRLKSGHVAVRERAYGEATASVTTNTSMLTTAASRAGPGAGRGPHLLRPPGRPARGGAVRRAAGRRAAHRGRRPGIDHGRRAVVPAVRRRPDRGPGRPPPRAAGLRGLDRAAHPPGRRPRCRAVHPAARPGLADPGRHRLRRPPDRRRPRRTGPRPGAGAARRPRRRLTR